MYKEEGSTEILTVIKNGHWYGSITEEAECDFIAHGQLGEGNVYPNLLDAMATCLSGHGIDYDEDIYFN